MKEVGFVLAEEEELLDRPPVAARQFRAVGAEQLLRALDRRALLIRDEELVVAEEVVCEDQHLGARWRPCGTFEGRKFRGGDARRAGQLINRLAEHLPVTSDLIGK